jgi:hypothetical protein
LPGENWRWGGLHGDEFLPPSIPIRAAAPRILWRQVPALAKSRIAVNFPPCIS